MGLKRIVQRGLRQSRSLLRSGRIRNRHADSVSAQLVAVPRPFENALFNFTVDFELFWGNAKEGQGSLSEEKRLAWAKIQIENFLPFVALLEEFRFPISWAILGKLLSPSENPPAESRFAPAWATSDWYKVPAAEQKYWAGRELLGQIKSRLPHNEILSHGFAHIDYRDPQVTRAIAQYDLQRSKALLEEFGFPVSGFVFPCNRVGHVDLLPEAGYDVARGDGPQWEVTAHLVKTPIGFWISPGVMAWKDMKQVIDRAVAQKAFVHPWMHLIECSLKERDLKDFYRPLFEYVLELQAKGKMENVSFKRISQALTPNATRQRVGAPR